MSELPKNGRTAPEVIQLRPHENEASSWRFGGLPVEKALAVAEAYLDPADVAMYLRPFLGEGRLLSSIAQQLGDSSPYEVELHIQKLEIKVAEAHLANIPRGYGHAATILALTPDKTPA